MISFICEFSTGEEDNNFQVIPTSLFPNQAGVIIQTLDTYRPESSYWSDTWGGTFDNPDSTDISIFIEKYLIEVPTKEDLLLQEDTYLKDGTRIHIHISKYLWQIWSSLSIIEQTIGFSTNVKDPRNPSDDRMGPENKRYEARMSIPRLPERVSSSISGTFLFSPFTINLINNDGFFDTREVSKILNTVVKIKKSVESPATYDSFKTIRIGRIDNINLTMDQFSLSCSDFFKTLEEPVTRTIQDLNIGYEGTDIYDTNLNVVYGSNSIGVSSFFEEVEEDVEGEPPITTNVYKYVLCDPNYFYGAKDFHDGDKEYLPGEVTYSFEDGIITTNQPVSRMTVKGQQRTLGGILQYEIAQKSNIPYTATYWNMVEADTYAEGSPYLNLVISDGSVIDLVRKVIANDTAFFIQQRDGRFTLRKWGRSYKTHTVPNWLNTQPPTRSFSDSKNFCSSVLVKYTSSAQPQTLLNKSIENEVLEELKKKRRVTFATQLSSENDAKSFSNNVLNRFAKRPEIWKVSTGEDTSEMESLDNYVSPLIINDRKMSNATNWIILGIDPGQDSLILEENSNPPVSGADDIPLSHPFIDYYDGYNSQPYSDDGGSGYLSRNTIDK